MRIRTGEPRKLGLVLEEVLSAGGYYNICKEYAIVHTWPSIVNPHLARSTVCERIEGGILYVKVVSAPWRQEAVYRKEEILTRIRNEFGCRTIADIVFY